MREVGEREREREKERKRDRETETETDRQTDRQIDSLIFDCGNFISYMIATTCDVIYVTVVVMETS